MCRRSFLHHWVAVAASLLISSTCLAQTRTFENGDWPTGWPRELQPYRSSARTFREGNGTDTYVIFFNARSDFEGLWPILVQQLKSPDGRLSLYSISPNDFSSPNHNRVPAVRIVASNRAPNAGQGADSRPATQPTVLHAVYDPGASLRIDLELVVDGSIINLNRVPLPAGTPIIDKRVLNPSSQPADEMTDHDKSMAWARSRAVKLLKRSEVEKDWSGGYSRFIELSNGPKRSEVEKVFKYRDDIGYDGGWTSYVEGPQVIVDVHYDGTGGKWSPENVMNELKVVRRTPQSRGPASEAHKERLCRVTALAREVVRIGATRADVEKAFTGKDGGIQGASETRYYAGDEVMVEVYYVNKAGESWSPEDRVTDPPYVYRSLMHSN